MSLWTSKLGILYGFCMCLHYVFPWWLSGVPMVVTLVLCVLWKLRNPGGTISRSPCPETDINYVMQPQLKMYSRNKNREKNNRAGTETEQSKQEGSKGKVVIAD